MGPTNGGDEYATGHSKPPATGRSDSANEYDENQAATGRPVYLRSLSKKRSTKALAGWWLPAYAFVLGVISVGLAPDTAFWWLVPLFGLAALVALAAINRPGSGEKEREIIEALHDHGEITPTEAALRTSLTVDEAAKMLEGMAQKGHLRLLTQDGVVAYALQERGRASPAPTTSVGAGPEPEGGEVPQALVEPLSRREMEGLNLLSSGRTNSEIAGNLFVSVGTIKTHANNIYRKLEVRNRTEALARARELKLLR